MVRKLLYVSLLFPFTSFASPSSFNGPYVGLQAGGLVAAFDVNKNDNIVYTFSGAPMLHLQQINNPSLSNTTAFGGVNVGYGAVISHNIYLGLEASANVENLHEHYHSSLNEEYSNEMWNTTVEISQNNAFNFVIKPGVLLSPHTLIYGLAGASVSKFTSKINSYFSQWGEMIPQVSATSNEETSKYATGLLLGIGLEQQVTDHLGLKLEYNYIDYGTILPAHTVFSNVMSEEMGGAEPPPNGFNANTQISAKENLFSIGIVYHFA